MKSTNHATVRPALRRLRITGSLIALLAASGLASCTSTSPVKSSPSHPATLGSVTWHKVKNDPPTYFPAGVPADHPTEFTDGMWVATGDQLGTRYFIPEKGANTKARISAALAMVTPAERERLAQRKKKKGGERTVRTAAMIPAAAVVGTAALMMEVMMHSPQSHR